MKLTRHRKLFFTVTQAYYHDVKELLGESIRTDILIVYQSPTPATTGLVKKFSTRQVDLTQTGEDIFSRFGKTTRYQIRRAKGKDNLNCTITTRPDGTMIAEFIDYYNGFSSAKGLPPCNPGFLQNLNQQGLLSLSVIRNSEEETLASHAHIISNGRARLYKSASSSQNADTKKRALIGRANRYLHAEEILYFKEMGLKIYDFGGISLEKQRRDLQGIDKFKMGFGGRNVEEFHCVVPISFLGKMAFYSLKRRWKKCIE